MFSMQLQWKEFSVNLAAVDAFLRSEHEHYVGNQAHSVLELWFSVDPNLIPMHDVTYQRDVVVQQEVEVQVQDLDENGDPVLDENGDPVTHPEMQMQDVTVQEDYIVSEPSGEPSVAQAIEAYWEALNEEADEAVSYQSAADINADRESKKASGKAKLAALGLTAEEIAALVG